MEFYDVDITTMDRKNILLHDTGVSYLRAYLKELDVVETILLEDFKPRNEL